MNEDLKYLSNCHTLNLSHCDKITDEGLKYLATCHTLNLFGCNDITDKGLKYLEKCNTICVDVSFTKNITENCIMNLGNIYLQFPGKNYYSKKYLKYNKQNYENKVKNNQPPVYNNTERYEYNTW